MLTFLGTQIATVLVELRSVGDRLALVMQSQVHASIHNSFLDPPCCHFSVPHMHCFNNIVRYCGCCSLI